MQQAHSWTYNLRRQNRKDTGRQICIAQYYHSQDMEGTKKVHQQMGGPGRTSTFRDGISASEKMQQCHLQRRR